MTLSWKKREKNRSGLLFASVLALSLIFSILPSVVNSASGVPKIISYQGRLTDPNGNLLGGSSGTNFFFKFSIWDSPTSSPATGNRLWPSTAPGITTSTVVSGVFNVDIGDTANGYPDALTYDFYSNQDVFLQVEVSSNGSSFEILSPRQRIAASGFAVNANNVSGALQTSSTADYTFNVFNIGTGRANLNVQGQTQLGNFATAPTSIGGGSLYYNTNTGQVFVWNAATTTPQWVALGGSSGGTTTDLQGAYNLGNVIQTTNGRDILFILAPATTSSNFIVNIAATSTGLFEIQASSTQVLTISQTAVTSTAALSWNIQGAATLSTTTVNGLLTANTLSSAGATISGGTINNTPIGNSTPAVATFTAATTTGNFTAQGVVSLATTTITNGNFNISTGSLQLNGIGRIDNLGRATLTTSTISSLTVSGTSTLGQTNISTLNLSNPLAISSGGTGQASTPTNGQLLIGNGTNYSLNTLQGSTYLGVTNGAGTIALNNLGVQSLTGSAALGVSSATGTITLTNLGVTALVNGTGISVSNATGSVTITNTAPQVTSTINGITSNTYNFQAGTSTVISTSSPNIITIGLATNTISQFVNDKGYLTSASATTTINGFQNSTFTLQGTAGQIVVNNSNGTSTWSLATTTVIAGTYTYASTTVDQYGRITAVANGVSPLVSLNGSTSSTQTFSAGAGINIATANGIHTFTNIGVQSFNNATGTVTYNPFPVPYASTTGVQAAITWPIPVASTSLAVGGGLLTLTGNTLNNTANYVSSTQAGTGISLSGQTGTVTITNIGVTQLQAGTNINLNNTTGTVTVAVNQSFATATISGLTFTNATGTNLTATGITSSTNTFHLNTTTTNLAIIGLAGQTGCLSVNSSGVVTTSTCSGGSGLTQLNGLTAVIQSFATTTSYTGGFNIQSSVSTHTFNFPGRINDINNIATTTGSLIVANGTTWVVQTVGSNNLCLTASSSQATGLGWASCGTGGTTNPGGSNTTIQYNNNSVFAGDNNFTWTSSTQLLTVNGTTSLQGGTLNIVNGALQLATTTRIDNLGQATLATTTISNLTVSGLSTLGNFTFTAATGTVSLVLTGGGTALQVTAGASAVQGLTFTSATGTGTFAAGTSTINGNLNIASGGVLQLNGSTRIDNLGQATLATSTISVLTVNTSSSLGNATFVNATGTTLSLTGAGTALQATAGTAALQGLTFTTATGTTALILTGGGTALSVTNSASIGNVAYTAGSIIPAAAFTIGSTTQNLTLQGATTTITSNGSNNNIVLSPAGLISVTGREVNTASGTTALTLQGFPQATSTASLLLIGPYNIVGGNATGTLFGANYPSNYLGDLINLQISSTSQFRVSNTGNLTLATALGIASGGTGQASTPTNGQLLIGNGTNYSLNTLQGSTYLGVTNGAGTIALNNLGVQSFNNATGTVTYNPFPVPYASTTGVQAAITWPIPVASTSLAVGGGLLTLTGNTLNNTANYVSSTQAGTGISLSGQTGTVTITNIGVTQLQAGTNINLNNTTGTVTVAVNQSFATATITTATTTNLYFTAATGTTLGLTGNAIINGVTYSNSAITPTAAFILGAPGQNLTLQGATTSLTAANTLSFSAGGTQRAQFDPTTGQFIIAATNVSSTARLFINAIATNAGDVGGIYQETTINPTVTGGYQFGNRHIVYVAPASTSTNADGQFVRMIDNTSQPNTVRAMELQAWSGTNIQGVNTALFAAGRTFGVQAVSNGTNGGVAQPAALYGEIQNSSQGNALRLYSSNISTSTQDMALLFQEISNFAGNGLHMDFGRTGGTFTGNFVLLQSSSTSKFAINATGTVMIGTSTPYGTSTMLVVCAAANCSLPASTSTVAVFASVDGTTTGGSIVAKGTIASQQADIGEYIPVVGSSTDYEVGDLISIDNTTSTLFMKSSSTYDANLVGVVTKSPAFIAGGAIADKDNSVILALAGRVLAKVTGENGPIMIGDVITASSKRGYGMKATAPGQVVGYALEAFSANSSSTTGTIEMFVNPHYAVPVVNNSLQGGSSGMVGMNTFPLDSSQTVQIGTLQAGKIVVNDLIVGTPAKPTGITLYDLVTGKPYCFVIDNGAPMTYPGACDTLNFALPIATTTQTSVSQTLTSQTSSSPASTNTTFQTPSQAVTSSSSSTVVASTTLSASSTPLATTTITTNATTTTITTPTTIIASSTTTNTTTTSAALSSTVASSTTTSTSNTTTSSTLATSTTNTATTTSNTSTAP